MNKRKTHLVYDSWIMFKRCLLVSLRSPEALIMATVTPFFLMYLFGTIYGNITDVGSINYIDFIVPGIIMQCVGQASQYSAINVSTDMSKGIIDRFRSMSISKSAILIAHTGAGVVRNTISTFVIIGSAFLLGFRPQGNFVDWVVVIILLLFINIAISLVGVLCGLISKTPEGSGAIMFPLFILPFVSSGFAPIEGLSESIRWIAKVQPMTPMIDSIRSLTLGLPQGNEVWIAFAWCFGIIIVAYIASMRIYNNRTA